MPIRKTRLEDDYYYHIFNRSIAKIPIFTQQRDFLRATDCLNYYRFKNTPLSFSKFIRLNKMKQENILVNLEEKSDLLIEITAFCLMPNHFHFLLKQCQKNGIVTFLGNFQNSYAKYFDIKYQRTGALFQNSFKSVLIEDDDQLLHLSRYIHLNPYSAMIIKTKKELTSYLWSSFPQYIGKTDGFCQPKIVLDQFKSPADYKKFVFDQADYQKELEKIKHLAFEQLEKL